jgi:hypothetical protein
MRRAIAVAALMMGGALAADAEGPARIQDGGVVRGPTGSKRIALEFTGHEFAEGGTVILDDLLR